MSGRSIKLLDYETKMGYATYLLFVVNCFTVFVKLDLFCLNFAICDLVHDVETVFD